MKKGFILLVGACIVISAYAEIPNAITFCGFGRTIVAPVVWDGTSVLTGGGTSWGAPYRIGFGINGDFGRFGFHADLTADNGMAGCGDEQKIWAKLLNDHIRITAGVFQDNTLRSDAVFGAFNWLRGGYVNSGEDTIFRRIQTSGLGIAFIPCDSLYMTVGLPFKNNGTWSYQCTVNNIQAAVGYTIKEIGKIKLGYWGSYTPGAVAKTVDELSDSEWIAYQKSSAKKEYLESFAMKEKTTGDVAASFDFTAVENLYIGIGIVGSELFNKSFDTNLYARYTIKTVSCHLLSGLSVLKTGSPGLNIGIGFEYAMGNGIELAFDIRAKEILSRETVGLNIFTGLNKNFGNGSIGIGIQAAVRSDIACIGNTTENNLMLATPIRLQYWF